MFALFSDVVAGAWSNVMRLISVGWRNAGVELDAMLVRVNQKIAGGGS